MAAENRSTKNGLFRFRNSAAVSVPTDENLAAQCVLITGDYTQNRDCECNRDFSPVDLQLLEGSFCGVKLDVQR